MPQSRTQNSHKSGFTLLTLSISLGVHPGQLTGSIFLEVLDSALTALYGVIGGALPYDLTEFQKESATGVIRCRKSDVQKVWAAAAFMTHFRGFLCRLDVIETKGLVQQSVHQDDMSVQCR